VRFARDLYLLAMYLAQNFWDPAWGYLYPSLTSGSAGNLTAQQKQYCRARALAQWAVNVVDFRDRDSIMTCFVYDPDPFNVLGSGKPPFQWRPSGDPSVQGANGTTNDGGITTPHVVWGCEFPKLLITETLALHDRRTQDTSSETDYSVSPLTHKHPNTVNTPKTYNPPDPDLDFDQVTRPQGSLFVELYNPTSPYDAPAPELETFDTTSGAWSVDLSKTAPSGATVGTPVWRMLIYAPGTFTPAPTAATYYTPDPDDPLQQATFANANGNSVRYVYFTTAGNVSVLAGDFPNALRYCVSALSYAVIPPGRYSLVGPGQPNDASTSGANKGISVTCLGCDSKAYPLYPAAVPKGFYTTSRRIVLTPSTSTGTAKQVQIFTDGAKDDVLTLTTATAIQSPLAIVIDSATTSTAAPPRLSVSEPITGYPACDVATGQPQEQYQTKVYDTPLDKSGPFPTVLITKTYPCFGIVYLQRLANPTAAYNQFTNPYRTIDSMQIDLTSFNGISDPATPDPNDPGGVANSKVTSIVAFHTRERGYAFNQIASTANPNNGSNIWAHEPETLNLPAPSTTAPAVKTLPGTSVAKAVTWPPAPGPATVPATWCFPALFLHSFGYLNAAFGYPRSTAGSYVGAPQLPFPALAWNNRPFANPLELLLVPQCSSSQLLSTFPTTSSFVQTATPWSSFCLPSSISAAPYNPFLPFGASPNTPYPFAYGYLPNPFCVSQSGFKPVAVASPLVRLLDYVEVPSPFISARNQLDPAAFSSAANLTDANGNMLPFVTPFNWVSNYRDPGKVNLNTIATAQVWQGLTNYFPDATKATSTALNSQNAQSWPLWAKFVQSRRGYGNLPTVGSDMLTINNSFPTRFLNPFRSAAGAWLVPPVPTSSAGNLSNNYLAAAIGGEINTGLFRSEMIASPPAPPTPPYSTTIPRPLFQFDTTTNYTGSSLNAAGGVQLSDPTHPLNPDRNPMFRYQLIEKLSNTTTTRSNVYAVWITVGYFEARPGPVTQFHPDGYYLGQELGTDTGDIHRHRAFYIFDRSVPMGFVRGLDLNFDKGILIKRFIE
jgi:hypothetical protein